MIFLRPWLLLLIIVPLLGWLLRKRLDTQTSWEKIIDKRLLPYLLVSKTKLITRRWSWYEVTLWILLSIAAAGPAWDKTDVPTRIQQPGTVLVLELSPAMNEANLRQAQLKIYDILNQLKGEQVGLVLYDTIGYTASPLTPDMDIIRGLIPSLNTSVLPETGANAVAGFKQADTLFKNAGLDTGRILFITTGAFDVSELKKAVKYMPYQIGILGVGDGEGKPIPLPTGGFLSNDKGQPLLTRLNPADLGQLGAFEKTTPNDADIRRLIQKTSIGTQGRGQDSDSTIPVWHDRGIYLVLLCLPFIAVLFRRGIYFVLLLSFWAFSASAGWWLRPDQEVYARQMAGAEAYQTQQYEKAEAFFKGDLTDTSLYNLGNALAFQNKIDEAIAAYSKVLQLNPEHADAKYNKEYLEKQKKEQNQPQNQKDKENNRQDKGGSHSESNADMNQNQQNQGEQQDASTSEQQSHSNQDESKMNTLSSEQNKAEAEEQQSQEPESSSGTSDQTKLEETNEEARQETVSSEDSNEPFDQDSKQILNRLRRDPSRVLRYRIYQQYQRKQGG